MPADGVAHHWKTGQPVRLRWREDGLGVLEPAAAAPAGRWIAPALVDLQVNGFGGIDFQQDNLTAEQLVAAMRALRLNGCGSSLVTLVTDHWPRLVGRLRSLRRFREASEELRAAIGGWHVEGPFLSAEDGYCGAHDPRWMRDPTPADLHELRDATGSDPVLLTLAPERPGALAAIALAVRLGMRVSLGHTNASKEMLRAAVDAGATGFTHLGNACPRHLDRHDNILWRALETPGLRVSLIPDGIHVSGDLFRIVHRVLGPESIYYVSDAMAAAGAPPGRYRLGALELEVGQDQIVRFPGKTNFAGSALAPIDGVARAAHLLGCSWRAIWAAYSVRPAEWMGLNSIRGDDGATKWCLLECSPEEQLREWRVVDAADGIVGRAR